MALSRQRKEDTVSDVKELLSSSKLTVFAQYRGTSVKALQELRNQAGADGTYVRVIKNRLFKKAAESVDGMEEAKQADLSGQLIYTFNSSDEVAPAQVLANFAKSQPQIELVGAITSEGKLLSSEEVKELAALPSKDQLRGQLVGLIGSPLSGFTGVLSANVRGVLNVLSARAESLGQ